MAKDLDINIKVNVTDVNNATDKVDKLKTAVKETKVTTEDFGRSVKISYDETGKAVDVLVDKELNLTKQIRAVRGQMEILTATGKAQTQEFTILQRKFNDLNDNLQQNKARSQELFGTLSLLPGPVGAFAGQLQGAVDLLKTFSGVRLQDIKEQFKSLTEDISNIVKGFSEFGKSTKDIKSPTVGGNADALKEENKELEKLNENLNNNTSSLSANGGASAVAAKNQEEYFQKLTLTNSELDLASKNMEKFADKNKANFQIIKTTVDGVEKNVVGIREYGKAWRALEADEIAAVKSGKELSLNSKGMVTYLNGATAAGRALSASLQSVGVAAEDAAIAVGVLEGALAAIGIGVVIAALVALGDVLAKTWKYFTGVREETDKNKAATDAFIEALKREESALISELSAIDASNKALETRAKLAGKTESEILDMTKNAGQQKLDALRAYDKLLYEEQDLAGVTTRKQLKRINDGYAEEFTNGLITREQFNAKTKALTKAFVDNQKMTDEQRAKINKDINDKLIKNNLDIINQINANNQGQLDTQVSKDAIRRSNRIKELDNLIKLELDSNKINKDNLVKYYNEKFAIEHFGLEKSNAEIKAYYKDRDKTITDAFINEINRTIDGRITVDQKNLNLAKKGSEEYFAARKKLAEDEYQKELNLALAAGKDKDNKVLAAEVNLQKKLNDLADEKKAQKIDQDNKLIETSIAAINKEYEKSVAERQNKFKLEKDALQKQLQEKVITQDYYNSVILNKQKELDNDLEKLATDKQVKELTAKKAVDESRLKLLQEGTQAYYDQQRKIEEDNYNLQKAAAKDNATELERIEKEHADTMVAIGRAERDGKRALLLDHLDTVANIGSSLQKIAGKNKDIAKAGIRVEQAVTTAKIVLNDLAAIRKSYEASPLTFGLPWSAVYAVDMGLGVVAANVSANNAISALDSAGSAGGGGDTINRGKNYGSGGMIDGPSHAQGGVPITAEGGEAIMTRGAVTAFRPLLSVLNQMGGGTGFSNGVMGQAPYDNPTTVNVPMEPQIIKTYIVEQDLTTIQEKQARLKSLSTL
jgi:hypothetical protein